MKEDEEGIVLMSWDDHYSVGIPLIDEQHKELVSYTNTLYKACLRSERGGRAEFQQIAPRLVDYVKFHFSAEEQMMEKVNFPELAAHKKEHENFIKKVVEEVFKFEEDKRFVATNFVLFLKDWILSHIAVSDKQYSFYILNLKKQGLLMSTILPDNP